MINIRKMTIEDYNEVYELWLKIPGMGINDVDDSFEGIAKYLKRNPDTSFVAVDDESIGFGSREDCTYRDRKLVEMTYNANPYRKAEP